MKSSKTYHRHEALLGGMRTCAKDTSTAENVVIKEKQGEVRGPTNFKRTYSSETTTLEKLEADEEPEDDEIPVSWTRGGGRPLRRHRHEAFVRRKKTYSRETTTSVKLLVEDRQGEKIFSLDITTINVLVGNRQKVKFSSCYYFQKSVNNSSFSLSKFLQVYLGEVDGGKQFADVEVEELEAEVTEADAKDEPAKTGSLHRRELIRGARR